MARPAATQLGAAASRDEEKKGSSRRSYGERRGRYQARALPLLRRRRSHLHGGDQHVARPRAQIRFAEGGGGGFRGARPGVQRAGGGCEILELFFVLRRLRSFPGSLSLSLRLSVFCDSVPSPNRKKQRTSI